jgi:hypothetical protein
MSQIELQGWIDCLNLYWIDRCVDAGNVDLVNFIEARERLILAHELAMVLLKYGVREKKEIESKREGRKRVYVVRGNPIFSVDRSYTGGPIEGEPSVVTWTILDYQTSQFKEETLDCTLMVETAGKQFRDWHNTWPKHWRQSTVLQNYTMSAIVETIIARR